MPARSQRASRAGSPDAREVAAAGSPGRASWRHPLAFLAALLTFGMICLGATVTTIEAGDSDPTWTLRFWEWFRPAEGGLFYELLHRRLGTMIGFVAIGLVVSLWRTEERRWVRRTGYAAFGLILVQGLLGGLRIHAVSNPSVRDFLIMATGLDHQGVRMAIAVVHAFNAQLVFALLVVLTVVTSGAWRRNEAPRERSALASRTRRLCLWTAVLIFVQLVLGAYVRHGRVFYPDARVPHYGLFLWLHIAVAVGVLSHIFVVNSHTRRAHPAIFPIWHLAGLAKFLVICQLFLGFGAWAVTRPGETEVAMPWDVAMLVRTIHVANGAAIFAIFVTMTVRAYKLLLRAAGTAPSPAAASREAHA